MDQDELEVVLARLGRRTSRDTGVRGDFAPSWIETDPPVYHEPWERGIVVRNPFESEDALCRWWLTRELLREPQPVSESPDGPLPRPDSLVAPRAGDGAKWRRPLSPLSTVVGRGDGLIVVADTTSLLAHGTRGALAVTALDAATGRERWSTLLWPPTRTPVVAVLPETVVVATRDRLQGLDAETGAERWRTPLSHTLRVPATGRPVDPVYRPVGDDGVHVVLAPFPNGALPDDTPDLVVDSRTGAITPRDPVPAHDGLLDRLPRLRREHRAEVAGGVAPLRWPVRHNEPAPRRGRWLVAVRRGGAVDVLATTLDGEPPRRLLRASAPDGFDEAVRLVVTHDGLDAAGTAGFVVVRASDLYDNARLDVVIAADGDVAAMGPGLLLIRRAWRVQGLGTQRVVVHDPEAGARLVRLDDHDPAWSRDEPCTVLAAGPERCLVGTGRASGARTALVESDGSERWSAAGELVGAHDGVVAVREYRAGVMLVDEPTGAPVIRLPVAQNSNQGTPQWPLGFSGRDGLILTGYADVLCAWRVGPADG